LGLVAENQNPSPAILDRLIFKHKRADVFMVADAYRGKEISQAIWGFLEAASGKAGEQLNVEHEARKLTFNSGGSSDLVVYVGHDGLMDFTLQSTPKARDNRKRKAIILACVSQKYFAKPLERTGAVPLVWTTGLMAPEAYILSAAIDGWLKKETDEEIRIRAAKAYNSYQNCGLKAASNLFATGWLKTGGSRQEAGRSVPAAWSSHLAQVALRCCSTCSCLLLPPTDSSALRSRPHSSALRLLTLAGR
jgi:hypothetical protein